MRLLELKSYGSLMNTTGRIEVRVLSENRLHPGKVASGNERSDSIVLAGFSFSAEDVVSDML
jgi:hypothetical protein